MGQIKEENALNKTKIFLLEQELIKKNNMIEGQKKKLQSLYDLENEDLREIYIIDPSKAVAEINDELLLYKKIHQKLLKGIKRNQMAMKKYDSLIADLQNENGKLKNKFRIQVMASNRERNTIKGLMSQNNRKANDSSSCKSNLSHNNIKGSHSILFSDEFKIKMKLRLGDGNNTPSPMTQINENEEIVDILKNCGLSIAEFEKMMKNKTYYKLAEVIEMLLKSLLDKTMSLHLLEVEIEDLNMKNFKLNQENMNLNCDNSRMRNELKRNRSNFQQEDSYLNNNSDMASDYTAGRNITSTTITNYQKLLEKQQQELYYEPDMVLSFDKKETTIIQNKETNDPQLNRSGISDSSSLDDEGNTKQFLGMIRDSNAASESNVVEKENENNKCNSNDANTIRILSTNSFKSGDSISSSEFRKGVTKNINEEIRDSNGMNSLTSSVFEDIQVIKSNNNV